MRPAARADASGSGNTGSGPSLPRNEEDGDDLSEGRMRLVSCRAWVNHCLMRRTALHLLVFILLLAFVAVPALAAAPATTFVCPVYLNGESLYTQTGSAGLLSVAADAARSATEADVALLPADAVAGSVPAGEISAAQLQGVFPGGEEPLVLATVTSGELVTLLNECMTYGSAQFPHISGLTVYARRVLDDTGSYAGRVEQILQGTQVLASRAVTADDRYSTIDTELTLVTTHSLVDALPWLAPRARNAQAALVSAFRTHIERTPDDAISYYAESPRLVITSDTIYTDLVIRKLGLPIPSPVVVNLSRPDVAADTILFALSGQDRRFTCRVFDGEIPYALSISGLDVHNPSSVNTSVSVTQTLPAARKTANTFDDNTVFVDLRYNATVPAGSLMSVDMSGIYPSETILHVYYYDANGDIVPAQVSTMVDASGWITFPVEPSTTYLINSRELDSTGFVPPTAARPYAEAIALIFGTFCLWVVLFVAREIQNRRKQATDESPE